MAPRERIAHGEVYIEVNDEQARAALKAIDRDFERTMRDIDHEEATVTVDAELAPFEDKLKKAKRQLKAAEGQKATIRVGGNTAEIDKAILNLKRKIKRLEGDKAVVELKVKGAEKAQAAIERTRKAEERRAKAFEQAEARRENVIEQVRRKEERAEKDRIKAVRDESAYRARVSKMREQELASAHRWALQINRDMDQQAARRQQEARDIPRLQRKYADLEHTVARLNRERGKVRTAASPALSQRVDIKQAEAIAEMEQLRLKLRAMGSVPIDQKINLDINEQGVGLLGKWITAITETTVRIGPLTTTLAGLGKGLLLLGPIVSGIVGHFGALTAAVGAGLAGGLGVAGGALAAFGVSLGGVGFLLPSLLRDFKNLNTLQGAYHKQVLKTGVNSEKAKDKLKEFNHALGEVSPTTRKAFKTLSGLQDRFRGISKAARPDFFNAFGASVDALNHHFNWFRDNTLAAFHQVSEGWQQWMSGLESSEADRILQQLGRNGNASIRPLMKGLGSLASAFGRVAASFSNHLPSLLDGFSRWSGGVAGGVKDTERLDGRVTKLVGSMRALGHFVAALGRWFVALLAPGVDVGTKSLDGYAEALNRGAERMRTTQRSGLVSFFEKATATSEKFFKAIAPFAALFLEWTTIMAPFTDVALGVLRVFGRILHTVLGFGPAKTFMQGFFAVLLVGSLLKRITAIGSGMWSIAKAVGAIKAAGGLGAALKGGAIRFATGGLRGQTFATPMYVLDVGGRGPGGPGALPGRGGPKPGGIGGIRIPVIGRVIPTGAAAGVAGLTAAMVTFGVVMDRIASKRNAEKNSKQIQSLVSARNIGGLRALQHEYERFGKTPPPNLQAAINQIKKFNEQDTNKLANNVKRNWDAMLNKTHVTFTDMARFAERGMQIIARSVRGHSESSEKAARQNFRSASRAIKQAIQEGKVSSEKGMAEIHKLWVEVLKEYGFSAAQARNIGKGRGIHGGQENQGTGQGAARGGLFTVGGRAARGRRGVDNVPAVLNGQRAVVAEGEQVAVFNRHQQQAMDQMHPGGLEGFFSRNKRPHYMAAGGVVGATDSMAHYAPGGIVPVPGFPGEMAASSILGMIALIAQRFHVILTDAYGQGHQSPGHTVTGTAADFSGSDANMARAVKFLVGKGYLVGYDGSYGSQNWPGHGPSTKTPNYHFHVELGGKSGGAAGGLDIPDLKRVTATPGLGNVTIASQAALDTSLAAAQANLERVTSTLSDPVAGGAGGVGGGAALGADQLRSIIAAALRHTNHYSAANAAALFRRVMQESGGNPRAINMWDSNAKAGHPSKGLGQTIDSTFQSYRDKSLPNDIYDPLANLVASIRYMISKYGRIVDSSSTGYAKGGIVMDRKTSKQGGKVDSPRLLVGEEPRHGETVISHNPAYRKSNLEYLTDAARKLGVPMARKGRGAKVPKKLNSGKNVDRLTAVKNYGKWQQRETDKGRQISIEESKIREPETMIKQVGTDPETKEPIYAVDWDIVKAYKDSMERVKALYNDLVDPAKGIFAMLRLSAQHAFERIASYIEARRANIQTLQNTIHMNKRLLNSKDSDVRDKAQRRIDKAQGYISDQKGKIGDATSRRTEIGEDQHDARFREQEAVIGRDSMQHDIDAVDRRANEDATSANPQKDDAGSTATEPGLTYQSQLPLFDSELANIARQYGGNANPNVGKIPNNLNPGFGGAQGLQENPALIGTMPGIARGSTVGGLPFSATGNRAMTKAISSSNEAAIAVRAAHAPAATTGGSGGIVGAMPGATTQENKTVNITNHFQAPPADPLTWTKGVGFEAGAAI